MKLDDVKEALFTAAFVPPVVAVVAARIAICAGAVAVGLAFPKMARKDVTP